jgi:hypothetical protein
MIATPLFLCSYWPTMLVLQPVKKAPTLGAWHPLFPLHGIPPLHTCRIGSSILFQLQLRHLLRETFSNYDSRTMVFKLLKHCLKTHLTATPSSTKFHSKDKPPEVCNCVHTVLLAHGNKVGATHPIALASLFNTIIHSTSTPSLFYRIDPMFKLCAPMQNTNK